MLLYERDPSKTGWSLDQCRHECSSVCQAHSPWYNCFSLMPYIHPGYCWSTVRSTDASTEVSVVFYIICKKSGAIFYAQGCYTQFSRGKLLVYSRSKASSYLFKYASLSLSVGWNWSQWRNDSSDIPSCERKRGSSRSGHPATLRLMSSSLIKSLRFVIVLALKALHRKQHFSCIMLLIWLQAIAFCRLS